MKEVIVLAGGLGTRLRSEIEETPKVLAPINDIPFLEYLLDYLEGQWVDTVILALGFQSQQVLEWLKGKAYTFKLNVSLEHEPLGTGGAIKRALLKSKSSRVVVMNGDTYFPIDLNILYERKDQFPIHVGLTKIQASSRYGQVIINEEGIITDFLEKDENNKEAATINAGVYLLNKEELPIAEWPTVFSWEKEVLEPFSKRSKLKGIVFDDPFIDIGVPEDYEKAQTFIPKHSQSEDY